jgi:hypothetical protein
MGGHDYHGLFPFCTARQFRRRDPESVVRAWEQLFDFLFVCTECVDFNYVVVMSLSILKVVNAAPRCYKNLLIGTVNTRNDLDPLGSDFLASLRPKLFVQIVQVPSLRVWCTQHKLQRASE